jgi:hypothetical protein
VDVDVGWFGGGGSADFETIERWNNSSYVNQKREDFARRLEEAAAQLSGTLPVLTGMRFNQEGKVSSINFDDIRFRFGSFTIGQATLETELSLRDYAATVGQAQQVEALRVPQVLVGYGAVVGQDGAYQNPGDWPVWRDVPISFPKPFAEPPSVAVALHVVNNPGPPGSAPLLTYVTAVNITNTGFTMRFGTHADTPVYWMSGTWIATGQAQVSRNSNGFLAGLGTPGLPPLIPAEARQAVLTPQLQSRPQLANGQFRASFNAIPGRTYQVESSTNLRPDDWSPLGTVTASDFLAAFALPVSSADPHRFFRVSTP